MISEFDTEIRRDGGAVVVAVSGEVDLATAQDLWAAVQRAFGTGDRLVLDLSNVTFIDSSGLEVLLRASQVLGRDAVVIRSPKPQARRLFETAGVDELLTVE